MRTSALSCHSTYSSTRAFRSANLHVNRKLDCASLRNYILVPEGLCPMEMTNMELSDWALILIAFLNHFFRWRLWYIRLFNTLISQIPDNMGINPHLIHSSTIESVVGAFPRKKWSGCFAATIRKEIGLKPWCHTTSIEGFAEGVEGNKLMEPYDWWQNQESWFMITC